jgi:hypothetical protein
MMQDREGVLAQGLGDERERVVASFVLFAS